MRPRRARGSVLVVGAMCALSGVAGEVRGGIEELKALSARGMGALGRQDYAGALGALREGAGLARRLGETKRAALFENALCGASFGAMEYGSALAACGESIRLAKQVGEREIAGVAELNRSNFLLAMGDVSGAEVGLEQALGMLEVNSPYRAAAMSALGTAWWKQGRVSEARQQLWAAVDKAGESSNRGAEAFAWGALGELELREGRLGEAERAFLATYRIRRLHGLPQLEVVWAQLGDVKVLEGKAEEGLLCYEHGLESRKSSKGLFAAFRTLEGKAEALRLLGRMREARAAVKAALAESRVWRNEVAPAEGLEVAADVRLGRLAAAYTELSGGSEREAWEAFEAVETTRAAGLRRQILVNRAMGGRIDAEHAGLVRAARVLSRRVLNGEAGAERELQEVEARLTRVEGATRVLPAGLAGGGLEGAGAEVVRRVLERGQALITFQTGPRESRVWVVTREGRATARLGPSGELARAVEAQRRGIAAGRRGAGRRLYEVLFGGIPGRLLEREKWTVVADGPLWSAAWAALEPGEAGAGRYLVERRRVELLPSASWLLREGERPQGRWLLAAGDGVHNRADSRFREGRTGAATALSFWVWPGPGGEKGAAGIELPTLAGSARELAGACEAWTAGPCRTLRGTELTYERLAAEMAQKPAVVHLATHLVTAADGVKLPGAEQGFLALSLRPDLTREGLQASDVSRMQAHGALIVLSACGSGRGAELPGAGLQGFSRAWLAAGARGVMGTLWPVADESGALFGDFYRGLADGASPAQALRRSQLAAIRAGGWRSEARLWAAYMLLGKD